MGALEFKSCPASSQMTEKFFVGKGSDRSGGCWIHETQPTSNLLMVASVQQQGVADSEWPNYEVESRLLRRSFLPHY
jgi:hypothetical protein